jgi:hypothetical protein
LTYLVCVTSFWIAMTTLVLSGCTYGGIGGADWPMPYTPTTTLASNGRSVAISVEDERPYVLSHEKPPTFIGVVRPYFGIAQDTTFEPTEDVSEKMERDIAAEVSAQGYDIAQGDYTMDVVVREFKHDGWSEITLVHDLEVTISHQGQKRTTTIKDERSGTPVSGWSALLEDYYSTMIRSIVSTLEDN